LGRVLVAYSGGVDSTLLLKAACDSLGCENVSACIASGPLLGRRQYESAVEMADVLGVRLETVEPGELADANFVANKADRCYYCKSHLLEALTAAAGRRGVEHILLGDNLDDISGRRPGRRAMREFGVLSPLADAKLCKADIRQLSRELGLPTADLPASPCFASRIVYGLPVTRRRLKQVEAAEEFLWSLGLAGVRVRHHDTIARIEVSVGDIEKATAEPVRSQIVQKLKSLGFAYVSVDLEGFRSGSLDEVLGRGENEGGG